MAWYRASSIPGFQAAFLREINLAAKEIKYKISTCYRLSERTFYSPYL
jgi:hypothetical protein